MRYIYLLKIYVSHINFFINSIQLKFYLITITTYKHNKLLFISNSYMVSCN